MFYEASFIKIIATMLYTKQTYEAEKTLVDWVRTGNPVELKATRQDGLKQYRRLFRNNIHNTLVQSFPIAFEVLTKEEWNKLVDDFFALGKVTDGRVWLMAENFYEFVVENDYITIFDKPWLNDLLLFEWVEIEVHTMNDVPKEHFLTSGDSLNDVVEINPEYRLINLEYPVHLYAANQTTRKKGSYFLLVYRDPDSFKVKFSNLHPLAVVVFEKIRTERKSLQQIIDEMDNLQETPISDTQKLELQSFVKLMLDEKAFLGYKSYYKN